MVPEIFEQILNLFDNCHSHGKPLQLSIDHDLVKILPLPHKLIRDYLTDQPIHAICWLSEDKNTLYFKNNLCLCSTDQNQGDSCHSLTCEQLHICQDYILNNNCSQFQSLGKCSHSHSLSTDHNEKVLNKFSLSSKDEDIFKFISRLTRLSLPSSSLPSLSSNQSKILVQSINKQHISDDLIDQWLGTHKSLLVDQKLINSFTIELMFDDDEIASMMKNIIKSDHSTTALIKENSSSSNVFTLNDLSTTPNDNRQDRDLDREVQYTTEKTSSIIDRKFSNQLKTNDINKSSSEYSIPITFGRGRGRQTFNTIPNVPLVSRESSSSSLNNQSPQNSFRNITSKLSSPNDQTSSNESFSPTGKKPIFSNRLNSKLTEQIKTKSVDNPSNSTLQRTNTNLSYSPEQTSPYDKTQSTSPLESFNRQNNRDDIHKKNYSSPTSPDEKCKPRFVLRGSSSKNIEKSPVTTTTTNQTLITYKFNKPFSDEHICYLLGPKRQYIIEKDHCQILSCLPSGYCRVTRLEQGKEIEKHLNSLLPETLNFKVVKTSDDLALLICSSAGENIFEQNQTKYAIISEPAKVSLNIDIIQTSTNACTQSSPISTRHTTSSGTERNNSQQISSDGKFYISKTNSSIDVICGDISEIPVDLMICISTSNNLCSNVLRRAGSDVQSKYKESYKPPDAVLLNGGLTKAQKILFMPWETDIQQEETREIQKSLSDLVKWCINKAHSRNMKSISFPPIGTGQLGLDPAFVSEAMISAASECLHQYQIDVTFVIYSSNGMNEDDECYQVFRIYLDSLCDQIQSNKISTPTTNLNVEKQSVKRNTESKRIITLSDLQDIDQYHNLLIKSLAKLMDEKTFDLSLIESSFMDKIDLLIDICFQHNVIPRIDLSRKEITLRGDRESCLQCFFNLRQGKKIHEYSYAITVNGEKTSEEKFNSYISLKIDEAFAVVETNIRINDDSMIFSIDLNKLQVQINDKKQSAFLIRKPLNDSKIRIPSSWSSTSLMIRTVLMRKSLYESLACFQDFNKTMSMSDWQIERIESIENYPLYMHFMTNRKEETKLYFHGCPYSSVQSIIHYGFHTTNTSNYGDQFRSSSNESICFTRNVLDSHLYGTRRSSDGKHYIFAVEISKNDNNNDDFTLLSNKNAYLALPTYLIVYQQRQNFN
ncbi:unnamed protein product [Adineta steineri]|uniref:Macro domain-containing protein n=1 Tax=Adineta steineri TaxID=433720 RepID=A0A814RVA5_9BILA|nr:unnamed protein product [Adineta steineri]